MINKTVTFQGTDSMMNSLQLSEERIISPVICWLFLAARPQDYLHCCRLSSVLLPSLWLCPSHIHRCILWVSSALLRPAPPSAGGGSFWPLGVNTHTHTHERITAETWTRERGFQLHAQLDTCAADWGDASSAAASCVPGDAAEVPVPLWGRDAEERRHASSDRLCFVLSLKLSREIIGFCARLQDRCSHEGLRSRNLLYVPAACPPPHTHVPVCSSVHRLLRNHITACKRKYQHS